MLSCHAVWQTRLMISRVCIMAVCEITLVISHTAIIHTRDALMSHSTLIFCFLRAFSLPCSRALSRPCSPSLAARFPPYLSLSHTHTYGLALSRSLASCLPPSLTDTLTFHTHSFFCLPLSPFLFFPLFLTPPLPSRARSLSLTHSHTHTYIHTHTQTRTNTFSLSLSLSLCFSVCVCLSC